MCLLPQSTFTACSWGMAWGHRRTIVYVAGRLHLVVDVDQFAAALACRLNKPLQLDLPVLLPVASDLGELHVPHCQHTAVSHLCAACRSAINDALIMEQEVKYITSQCTSSGYKGTIC